MSKTRGRCPSTEGRGKAVLNVKAAPKVQDGNNALSLVWLEIRRLLGVDFESQFKSGASQVVGAEHMGLFLAGTSAHLPSWEMECAEFQ